jgi:hypothetical protein
MSVLRGNHLADGRKVQVLWREITDTRPSGVCARAKQSESTRNK